MTNTQWNSQPPHQPNWQQPPQRRNGLLIALVVMSVIAIGLAATLLVVLGGRQATQAATETTVTITVSAEPEPSKQASVPSSASTPSVPAASPSGSGDPNAPFTQFPTSFGSYTMDGPPTDTGAKYTSHDTGMDFSVTYNPRADIFDYWVEKLNNPETHGIWTCGEVTDAGFHCYAKAKGGAVSTRLGDAIDEDPPTIDLLVTRSNEFMAAWT